MKFGEFGALATLQRLLKLGVWVWQASFWASHLFDRRRAIFNYFSSESGNRDRHGIKKREKDWTKRRPVWCHKNFQQKWDCPGKKRDGWSPYPLCRDAWAFPVFTCCFSIVSLSANMGVLHDRVLISWSRAHYSYVLTRVSVIHCHSRCPVYPHALWEQATFFVRTSPVHSRPAFYNLVLEWNPLERLHCSWNHMHVTQGFVRFLMESNIIFFYAQINTDW